MEIKLRQRIIGAVVLVALVIIFLPLLFKSSSTTTETKQVTLSAQIPPAPAKPPAASAADTIVMLQNKNFSTPVASTVANNSAKAPVIQQSMLATPSIIAANNQSASLVSATIASHIANAGVTKNVSSSNINSIEDETLNPPAANTTLNNAAVTNGQAHAKAAATAKSAQNSTAISSENPTTKKPLKKYEKAPIHKTTSASNQNANTDVNNELKINTAAKKHVTTIHHIKTVSLTKKAAATTHKTASSTTPAKATTKPSTTSASQPAAITNLATIKVPAGSAWLVQLGSFANESNAKDLVAKLRALGFRAYTQSIQSNVGNLIRVCVGPEVKREKADAINKRLASEMNIKGEVVRFSPIAQNK